MDALIDSDTMAVLQEVDEAAMPSTCRVLRRTRVVANGRTSPSSEASVGGDVICRLKRAGLRAREGEALGRLGETTFGQVHLPLGTDVANDDRIEVTTDDRVETFQITGHPWAGSYDTHITADIEREG